MTATGDNAMLKKTLAPKIMGPALLRRFAKGTVLRDLYEDALQTANKAWSSADTNPLAKNPPSSPEEPTVRLAKGTTNINFFSTRFLFLREGLGVFRGRMGRVGMGNSFLIDYTKSWYLWYFLLQLPELVGVLSAIGKYLSKNPVTAATIKDEDKATYSKTTQNMFDKIGAKDMLEQSETLSMERVP